MDPNFPQLTPREAVHNPCKFHFNRARGMPLRAIYIVKSLHLRTAAVDRSEW